MARRASGDLASLSTSALQAEIRRRKGRHTSLQRRYEKLQAKLEQLRKEIMEAGGAVVGSGGRARNAVSLVDSLQQVLKGKTMGVSEAAEAVLASGYMSTSPNFRMIVNQTFIKHRKLFKKVSRGRYTAA
ncbi:MAG: hypothetical protein U0573_01985 [Phycisphaerales bacterium]|nr:hypothetical protein [Planctomycetota bacterium]